MTSTASEIATWAQNLPYWEQFALQEILNGKQLDDIDYQQLFQFLLEDNGLAEKQPGRPKLQFDHLEATLANRRLKSVRLVAIENLENINALVGNQRLEFGHQLTAIFGANGSGKSGYARVLGSAAFTRGDKEVLPNVLQPISEGLTKKATIIITDGKSEKTIEYIIGKGCPELSGYYMFDSTAVQVHMSAANEISFSPAGLSALPKLAEATDRVRSLLSKEIENRTKKNIFPPYFSGDSAIKEMLTHLNAKTDKDELQKIAILSDSDRQRMDELDKEIAQLKAMDVASRIQKLKQTSDDLTKLTTQLEHVSDGLSNQNLTALADYLEQEAHLLGTIQKLGISTFGQDNATFVGTDLWFEFIESAWRLSKLARDADSSYPQQGDYCLFCHQPLSDEAYDLINKLWLFLQDDIKKQLSAVQKVVADKKNKMRAIDINFFVPEAVWYRFLEKENPALVAEIKKNLVGFQRLKQQATDAYKSSEVPSRGSLSFDSQIQQIRDLVNRLEGERIALVTNDPSTQIEELESELRTLQHKATLASHLDEIMEFIDALKWVEKAKKRGGSTRHITKKYNELFDTLVTQRYIKLFEETLSALGRSMQIQVKTRGRKGKTVKQIVVNADTTVPTKFAKPEKVLSEGEKRAVAVADFLTEVALDSFSQGVILDDPVTSLDLEWRHVIAEMLAREAQRQQVIVFTHDLPFLYYLHEEAELKKVGIQTHWIKRGDHDDKPGYVYLNNGPALEKNYKTSHLAQEFLKKAKKAPAEEQEKLLHSGFGALRTSYEALIIFELFNGVVQRWGERISFGRLEEIVWDEELAKDVVRSYERISRYIEGHLHSDAFMASKPTIAKLQEEISYFDELRKKVRNLKNPRK